MKVRMLLFFPMFCMLSLGAAGQEIDPIYPQFSSDTANLTETKVMPYTLPDPLLVEKTGKRVRTISQWETIQRPRLYHLFEDNVYGRYPLKKIRLRFQLLEEDRQALDGRAIRKQVRIYFGSSDTASHIDVLMYLPNNGKGKNPVFLGLNFGGNLTVNKDPEILISRKSRDAIAYSGNIENLRGKDSLSWPVNTIIENNFGVVTACYNDVEMDKKDGWKTGIRTTLQNELGIKPDEWGAIGAWAWSLSKIMDYIETDKDIDSKKVAVMGHSRLGKTALWAGASDLRFSIVISNESGEGGAAISRRWFGETVKLINDHFPHWFVRKYREYNNDVMSLPVDQHELLALIAPRPLYVTAASEDLWGDPKGQFLGAWHAGEVYTLYGKKGLGQDEMPPADKSIGQTIRFHNRTGKHAITAFDWEMYVRFANDVWNKQ